MRAPEGHTRTQRLTGSTLEVLEISLTSDEISEPDILGAGAGQDTIHSQARGAGHTVSWEFGEPSLLQGRLQEDLGWRASMGLSRVRMSRRAVDAVGDGDVRRVPLRLSLKDTWLFAVWRA